MGGRSEGERDDLHGCRFIVNMSFGGKEVRSGGPGRGQDANLGVEEEDDILPPLKVREGDHLAVRRLELPLVVRELSHVIADLERGLRRTSQSYGSYDG